MAEAKTVPTKASVRDFIAATPNETRRADAHTLLKVFTKATGWKAVMWGPSIIGFGRYAYTYDSGHSGEMLAVGFSPRSSNMALYIPKRFDGAEALLKKLGKHKASAGCLYVGKVADLDLAALEALIKAGIKSLEAKWPVTAR